MKGTHGQDDMNDLIRQIRALPKIQSPEGLSRGVMDALPSRRGFMGHLEYALRRELCRWDLGDRKSLLLPSNLAECGLTVLSAGIFFMVLPMVVIGGLYFSGPGTTPLSSAVTLFPVLAAAVLLIMAGWEQLKDSRKAIPQRFRFGLAGALFGLAMIAGWGFGFHEAVDVIAAWLGGSGLVVTGGLALIPRVSLSKREVSYAKNTVTA